MQRIFFILILLFNVSAAQAFDLFGTNINNESRNTLREVIRNNGAEVIREAGEDNWFDIYDMSAGFKQSKRLFVGYDKETARFAFAEYQLKYDYFHTMLLRLKAKYGNPEIRYGMFESDKKHIWQIDGIEIQLTQDWGLNVSRLIYSVPENLRVLRQAYRQSQTDDFTRSLEINSTYY